MMPINVPGPDGSVWSIGMAAIFGLGFGILIADVLLMLRPFARRSVDRRIAPPILGALVGAAIVGGLIAWEVASFVAASVGALLGSASMLFIDRSLTVGTAREVSAVLSDSDLRRAKETGERWVLVMGPESAGKTALIDQTVCAAVNAGSSSRVRLTADPRYGEDGAVAAVDLNFGGATRQSVRIWESEWLNPRDGYLPEAGAFDAFVLVVDPTRIPHLQGRFPLGIRPAKDEYDANRMILALADALSTEASAPNVWVVVTKVDLLRFCLDEELIAFPIRIGPAWHGQLSGLNVLARSRLAEAMHLQQVVLDHSSAFRWGRGSPLLAYCGAQTARGDGAFGGQSLLQQFIDEFVWN